MTKYPAPLPASNTVLKEKPADDDLEFPVAPYFLSLPPRVEPQAMLARLRETLPWRRARPGTAEERLAYKVDVEFIL